MKLLVFDRDYPTDESGYSDGFVEARVLEYQRKGHEVAVVKFFRPVAESYHRSGVDVHCAPDVERIRAVIADFDPDVALVHFFQGWMYRKLFENSPRPLVVWVHGIEALGFWRRLFNLSQGKQFLDYVKYNLIQLPRMRRLFRTSMTRGSNIGIIFVSQWMKRIAVRDTLAFDAFHDVIPNPISVNFFTYAEKAPELRHSILLIRSFSSRKYATDLACQALQKFLHQNPDFPGRITIVGSGQYLDGDVSNLVNDPRVRVVNAFQTHDEIKALHAEHGLFLCPTRQDAQGVSMCEAMSSGLIPLTSRSSAIPEFVRHDVDGFLTTGVDDLCRSMERLAREPDLFARMSSSAARHIRELTEAETIAERELAFMDRVGKRPQLENNS